MNNAGLEAVLKRDRTIVVFSALTIAGLAWAYILWLAADMSIMSAAPNGAMPTMNGSSQGGGGIETSGSVMTMVMPQIRAWTVSKSVFMFWMWIVMMVGMMLPSAAPVLLIHARVARQSISQGKPIAATGWFSAGYILAWITFSGGATVIQWALEHLLLLTPMMASGNNIFGGAVLIAVGIYQWTPLKDRCLSHCQSPFHFIQHHGGLGRDPYSSLRLGLMHGLYCVGCCWALMALLFVGGVMNVLWIAAIAIFVLAEKVVVTGHLISRISGVVFIAFGVWTLA